MNHTFKTENGHLIADVSFDQAEVKKATDKAVNRLCQEVTIKGFRKGKAPVEEARHYLRNEDVVNQTIDNLLRSIDKNFATDEEFQSYLKDNKLANGFRPQVSVNKFSADEASFIITYVLRPTISKLGSYKGLKSDVVEKKVDDAAIEAELKRLADDNAELVPTENAAKKGDTANIDFTGLLDGKEFEGGSSKGFDLELGSGRFVPGFEDQVIGHKAGEKFDVKVTMPENYPEPLSGKECLFKVTLNAVKEKQIPEINDEFATTLSGVYAGAKDLADLKAKVKDNLQKRDDEQYRNDKINAYLLQVRDASEYVIPSEYLDEVVKDREDEDTKNIEAQGLTLDEYLKLLNQTKEQYDDAHRAQAESEIKNSLVYNAIAEAEKIAAPTKEEIEKQIGSSLDDFAKNMTNYLRAQKYTDAQIQNQIYGYLNQVNASMMSAKVQARVLELNEPKKAEAKAEKKEEPKAEEKKAEANKAEEGKAA